MYKAVIKGEASLRVNANCSYGPDNITNTGCSNGRLLYDDHGTCQEGGVCQCFEGFTGRSEWINLKEMDCQMLIRTSKITAASPWGYAVALHLCVPGFP